MSSTERQGGDRDRAEQTIRRRVIYAGHVQGVLFRATSVDLSRPFAVVGFVRNLPDGTVELEAEGARDQVEGLLEAIDRHFRRNITEKSVTELPPAGSETRFEVRY